MEPALRNWYLATLGVVRYLPRSPAVAAPPGDTGAVAATAGVAPSLPQMQHAQGSSMLASLLEEMPANPAESPGSPQQQVAPAVDPVATLEPFRLAFWQPSPDLLVFDSLLPGRRPSPQHQELLQKILKAIGRLDGQLPAVDLIDWPVKAGDLVDLPGARAYLGVFLEARYRQRPFSWVLLMGETAARVIADTETNETGSGTSSGCELACGATGIVVSSLDEMLEQPQLKAGTWQAIRFLAT